MRLGIIAQPEAASFSYAKDLGLDFLEFDCNPVSIFGVPTEKVLAKLHECQEASARTGIPTAAVGRWGSPVIAKDGSIDPEEWKNVIAIMDFGKALGAKHYLASAAWVPELTYYQNITAAIHALRKIVTEAEDRGMDVSIVNCMIGGNYIRTPEQWKLVLPEVPGLKIKYDPSHSFVHGGANGRYLEEAMEWGGSFGYVHIKGVIQQGLSQEPVHMEVFRLIQKFPELRETLFSSQLFTNSGPFAYNFTSYDNPPAGLDAINWRAFFAALYQHGYNGDLSIEPHSRTWRGELGEKGVKYTIKYIRDLML